MRRRYSRKTSGVTQPAAAKDDRVHSASIASDQGVNPDTPKMLAMSASGPNCDIAQCRITSGVPNPGHPASRWHGGFVLQADPVPNACGEKVQGSPAVATVAPSLI